MPTPLNPQSSNPPLSSNFTPKISLKLDPSILSSKPNKFLFKIQSLNSSNSPKTPKIETLISIIRALPDWADEVKEKGMKKKRVLYNHERWAEHRSSLRYVRHVMTSVSSRVILSLIPPVVFFTSVAVFIAGYNTAVTLDLLPECFPVLRASSLPYQLTAPALALLLVFRTEASYSRFEEGRKAWTKVIAGTTDFARQVLASVDEFNDGVTKRSLLQYIMAFPIALKESKISCFHEGIGVCEELMGIPIPLSYTRLTSRFLVFWHLTLPVILWDDCHWIVVPATFVSAASLFCIEEVGVLIEEPFPMLALDELCKAVCSNIQEAIATEETIQAHVTAKRKSHGAEHSSNGRPASSV